MPATAPAVVDDDDKARALRSRLIEQLSSLGELRTDRVREAMARVPRHLFVREGTPLARAYANRPLVIGHGQTISQPTVVAIMTEALELRGTERVLEIGTGSGYQAAILSLLAREVWSIENVAPLAATARARLARLGYANVTVRGGDGYAGWPEAAPFDRVLVTAAPREIPSALIDQLAEGGILVAPVGPSGMQSLVRCRKIDGALRVEDLGSVAFVPMVPGQRDDGAGAIEILEDDM